MTNVSEHSLWLISFYSLVNSCVYGLKTKGSIGMLSFSWMLNTGVTNIFSTLFLLGRLKPLLFKVNSISLDIKESADYLKLIGFDTLKRLMLSSENVSILRS